MSIQKTLKNDKRHKEDYNNVWKKIYSNSITLSSLLIQAVSHYDRYAKRSNLYSIILQNKWQKYLSFEPCNQIDPNSVHM